MEKEYKLPRPQYPFMESTWLACEMGQGGYEEGVSLEEGRRRYDDDKKLQEAYEAGWLYAENQDEEAQ